MKKYLLLALSILLGSISVASAGYQQQGFSQYKENTDGSITFWCEKNCVILLGDKADNDFVKTEGGTHQGDGQWGYGYLLGQSVYAATIVPANSYEWSFDDDPMIKQLPAGEKQVVFLVSGPLKADNVTIKMGARSGGDAIAWLWKRFWNHEGLAPYSINLHYGPYVGGWAWPLFGLVVTLIVAVIAAVVRKKMNFADIMQVVVGTLIIVMVVGGVRTLVDKAKIIERGHKEFSSVSQGEKKFFELGNYISVTAQVRNQIDLDNVDLWRGKKCTIYAKSNMSWPFDAHWASVYLRPCTVVQTGSLADYGLYYNVQSLDATGSDILSGFNFNFYNFRP